MYDLIIFHLLTFYFSFYGSDLGEFIANIFSYK